MEWLWGLIGAAFLGLVGIVWSLLNGKLDDIRRECKERDDAIWDQIGRDSESGMRYKVHNAVPNGEFVLLEKRVDDLERRK